MQQANQEILNLIYRFAEYFDQGRFEEALELFHNGHFLVGDGQELLPKQMAAIWSDILILHDGIPRTRHVITNSIVEIDKTERFASCRSYYTVFQQADSLSLQPIISGRYCDSFAKTDGEWYFIERDYRLMDMMGDLSQHLTKKARARYGAP